MFNFSPVGRDALRGVRTKDTVRDIIQVHSFSKAAAVEGQIHLVVAIKIYMCFFHFRQDSANSITWTCITLRNKSCTVGGRDSTLIARCSL